ncbi:MAG: hypothetical protein Q7J14_00660 [Candidatus Magasanikbacteria bacterium]|nr:hypothetical protein [Candidatus Magasanikbacteria bacterium]
MGGNCAMYPCDLCGFDTNQRETKNDGIKVTAICLVCSNENFLERCEICDKFHLTDHKCNCQKQAV